MGIFTNQSFHARYRHAANCVNDRRKTKTRQCFGRTLRLGLCLITAVFGTILQAETIRIANFDTELKRRGPGLLLRDIISGKDKQVIAVAKIINRISPDIILLNGFDYDNGNVALSAFANLLAEGNSPYPYQFSLRPNTGMGTGLDMDGDGKTGTARDAQGYGWFEGQGGMAILSRLPIDPNAVIDFSALKWQNIPKAMLPQKNARPFPSKQALSVQRLSTTGHWVVPVVLGGKTINLLTFHATPPVFDGPEDRNGKRNHDEIRLWNLFLDGDLPTPPKDQPFIILGNANLDPLDGDGLSIAIHNLMTHPKVQNPSPKSLGAITASTLQGGANQLHRSDPALDTVDWGDDPGPGNLRVDYVLPSTDFTISDAGVFWPDADDPAHPLLTNGPRHRLVWVDIILNR